MPLSALLLSKDDGVMQVLRPVLPELGIQTDQCVSPETARRRLVNQKYEAVIVDAESPEAIEFMMQLRDLPMTRNAIIFAIIDDMPVTVAFQGGANFVLEKPLTLERVTKSFRAAHGLIMRERRRYYRYPVDLLAFLEWGNNREAVSVTNLSEGGMALKVATALVPGLALKWKLDLPDKKGSIEGKGEVSWADIHGHVGLRFVHVPMVYKTRLEEWLGERAQEEPGAMFLDTAKGWSREG